MGQRADHAPALVGEVDRDQRAEEHALGAEEGPHAELAVIDAGHSVLVGVRRVRVVLEGEAEEAQDRDPQARHDDPDAHEGAGRGDDEAQGDEDREVGRARQVRGTRRRGGDRGRPAPVTVAVLLAPEGVAPVDGRDTREVLDGRRRAGAPLEGATVPGIVPRRRRRPEACHGDDQEQEEGEAQHEGAHRRDEVPERPAGLRRVGVDPPRHADRAQIVLGEEGQVEADEEEPELELSQPLVEPAAGDLGPPVVEPGQEPRQAAADQYVVEVSHHEVAVGLLEVDRRRGVHDP